MEDYKLEGRIKEVIYNTVKSRSGSYHVEIKTSEVFSVLCHESGYIKFNKIVINDGDKVIIQVSPNNLFRGIVLEVIN